MPSCFRAAVHEYNILRVRLFACLDTEDWKLSWLADWFLVGNVVQNLVHPLPSPTQACKQLLIAQILRVGSCW